MKKLIVLGLSIFLSGFLAQNSLAKTYKEIFWEELMPPDWAKQIEKDFSKMKQFESMEDSDPKTDSIYSKLRKQWDEAPISKKYIGKPIRIAGYVVPLDADRSKTREFLIVPYFGACIHTPPPPANQIILVIPPAGGLKVRSMDPVWVEGILTESRLNNDMGVSAYQLNAAKIAPYK